MVYEGDLGLGPLNHALLGWQRIFNHVRRYRALDRRTPADPVLSFRGRMHLGLPPPPDPATVSDVLNANMQNANEEC
jgi:hypothetical protein